MDICKIRSNESSSEDYDPVLLGHARHYVFAEKWGIQPLRNLVLQKLDATLREYKPYEARCGNVVELIRYIYKNTPSRKRIDRLRELVTQWLSLPESVSVGFCCPEADRAYFNRTNVEVTKGTRYTSNTFTLYNTSDQPSRPPILHHAGPSFAIFGAQEPPAATRSDSRQPNYLKTKDTLRTHLQFQLRSPGR